jgi:hypothetical protein
LLIRYVSWREGVDERMRSQGLIICVVVSV